MIGTRKALRIDITIIICNPSVTYILFNWNPSFSPKNDVGTGLHMIMVISMPIIFTILSSLHPPSFHEMIFILVLLVFFDVYTEIVNGQTVRIDIIGVIMNV